MRPPEAKTRFQKFLTARKRKLARLTPAEGVASMIAFYREVRARGCAIDEDGDMLLFQWGIADLGKGPFEVDITRQLITGDGEDGNIWQLHLTFQVPTTKELRRLKSGNRWCHAPEEADEFTALVTTHAALMAVATVQDAKVVLQYERVG